MPIQDSEATGQVVSLLAGGLVFAALFAVVAADGMSRQGLAVALEAQLEGASAVRLVDVVTAPGEGWYTAGGPCLDGAPDPAAFTPEALARLGLAEEPCDADAAERLLSFPKFDNLFGAALDADAANGHADYEESRASLGLDDARLDFHLRSWPLLADLREKLGEGFRDPNLRPLYIGDYERVQGGQATRRLVQHEAGVEDAPDAATLWVRVTNNGTTDTMFSLRFTVPTETPIVVEEHTPLVAAGASFNATFQLNKTSDWDWDDGASPRFDYLIRGVSVTLGEGSVSLAGIDLTRPAPARRVLSVEMDQLVWVLDGPSLAVKATYDNHRGDGSSNGDYADWALEVRRVADDSLVATLEGLKDKGGTATFDLDETGEFRTVLRGGPDWKANEDRFSVVSEPPDGFTPAAGLGVWSPQPAVKREADWIAALVEQFDNGTFSTDYGSEEVPYVEGGDILPDDNRVLADELPERLRGADGLGALDPYNVLVIGSDVDHDALTSGNIKYPIRDWVEAGGSLLVLGSKDQAVQWLQPLFHAAIETAGGGVAVPDSGHPILHTPNDLRHEAFENEGHVWRFNQEDDEARFTKVVTQEDDAVLAVSDPGTFVDGRVVLTAWRPYTLTDEPPAPECLEPPFAGSCDGLQLFDNLLTIAYRTLYLDYGPEIPVDAPVSVGQTLGFLHHPQLGEPVEVALRVFVFA